MLYAFLLLTPDSLLLNLQSAIRNPQLSSALKPQSLLSSVLWILTPGPSLYALCLPREIRLWRRFHWGLLLFASNLKARRAAPLTSNPEPVEGLSSGLCSLSFYPMPQVLLLWWGGPLCPPMAVCQVPGPYFLLLWERLSSRDMLCSQWGLSCSYSLLLFSVSTSLGELQVFCLCLELSVFSVEIFLDTVS
jgi:hypothetical protein